MPSGTLGARGWARDRHGVARSEWPVARPRDTRRAKRWGAAAELHPGGLGHYRGATARKPVVTWLATGVLASGGTDCL